MEQRGTDATYGALGFLAADADGDAAAADAADFALATLLPLELPDLDGLAAAGL
jgi:hypothetical protein